MNTGGTYFLSGTSQGFINLYHIDVESGLIRKIVTSKYFFGGINQVFFTSNRDIGLLMDGGLIFVQALQDSVTNGWSFV